MRQGSTMILEDRVVMLTGAGGGLGREAAVALARAGATVAALGRNRERLQATCDAVDAAGGEAIVVECDVAASDEVASAVARTVERLGKIDVLVNNAGVATEKRAFDVESADLQAAVDVNLIGAVGMSRAVARVMSEAGGGKIVNIASVMAWAPTVGLLTYSATKAAMVQATRVLALEWARHGITVNCLAPGYFPTEINSDRLSDERVRQHLLRRIPLRRFGRPEEVGPTLVFLASPATDYMTGSTLVLDGGLSVA